MLAPLLAADRERVAAVLTALRDRRRAELAAAIDRALEHVPRLLRAPLKKVLFP